MSFRLFVFFYQNFRVYQGIGVPFYLRRLPTKLHRQSFKLFLIIAGGSFYSLGVVIVQIFQLLQFAFGKNLADIVKNPKIKSFKSNTSFVWRFFEIFILVKTRKKRLVGFSS